MQTFTLEGDPFLSFSTSVYLRDNAAANPLQGQLLYEMVSPHCLFILPADVISSCCCGTLTCHLPPSAATVKSVSVHAVQENMPLFISVGLHPAPNLRKGY